ncbi:MAG: methyltransferase domain-containing protein [Candidatus Nanoarchaeia archaeon]|nr:methyltransferase domain-containing protein [Candidatus Nanoarchaeia archaeon]MDD5499418.1 methyltransferase domain-containing protein [Candidatus Nanoarchaeia archaeon]
MNLMKNVIEAVLKKKELKGIDESIALKEIERNLTSKTFELIKKERFKSAEFKDFIKKVRASLRRQFGAFNNPKIDRKELIKKKAYGEILMSHLSSKERMPYYKEVYDKIFSIIGKPDSIIDLGCGFNPLSIEFMDYSPKKYLALDINADDLKIIQEYFRQKKINGEAKVFDATELKNYDFNENFDACFAFKVFEIFEKTKSHRLTEDIVLRIPSKKIAASFSTKTLSNAPMKRKRRIWFEIMAKRLGFRVDYFMIPNEIFYVLIK